LIKGGIKPLYKVLDVAKAKTPKYYLFVHCKKRDSTIKEIAKKILTKYI